MKLGINLGLYSAKYQNFIASGPTPVLNLNLTSTLPSIITFTRSGSRNYISNGVLTTLSSNQPAFESWDGVNRGLAIEPAFTNLQTYSNDFSNAIWTKTGGAVVTGDAGPGTLTQLYKFESTATNAFHRVITKPGSQASGLTQTWSAHVKPEPGSDVYSIWLQQASDFNNAGAIYHMRIDGNEGFFPVLDGVNSTNVRYGYRKLAGGVYLVWITGTWSATGNKQFQIGTSAKTNTDARTYTATTNSKFQMGGASLTTTTGPVGYVATGAATAGQSIELASFNDVSWLTTTQGTFVIEHDCWTGPLIGSGVNTIVSATVPGRTAIAWDGVTSDTVNNGGSATVGVQPTFSGSDLRLLATSSVTNTGHVKSIKFYSTRLSVPELQTLTSPSPVSTANPGTLRTVAIENRAPSLPNVTVGTSRTMVTRFKFTLGTDIQYSASELRLRLSNIRFAAETTVGNTIRIEKLALERVTSVSEYVAVTLGGLQSFDLLTDTIVDSDVIPLSSFTNLTEWSEGMEFWVRAEVTVTTAGHVIMGAREGSESGAFAKVFDPAATTYSSVYGTGPITLVSGTSVETLTRGFAPILVGKFVTGDPKTLVVVGDSTIEGTGSLGATGVYTKLAAQALGIPMLEISCGGKQQLDMETNLAGWSGYLALGRVLIDAMGRNGANANLSYFSYYKTFRSFGGDKIMKIGVFPATSGTFIQTILRAYPSNVPDVQMAEWLKYGIIDYVFDAQSIRGSNPAKWLANTTTDGTHQSDTGNNLLKTEYQAKLETITVT